MQPMVYNFVKKHSQQGRVLDIGSLDVNGSVRDLFPLADYIGLDMRPGDNVDVVGNSHDIPFDDDHFDMVLCLEMLEHDDNPFRTAREIKRVAKDNGTIIVCASGIGMHKHDNPSDYWRFTREGFLLLFKEFTSIEIVEGREEVLYVGINATPGSTINYFGHRPSDNVSIVIPIIRPECAERCIAAIKENAGVSPDSYEIITEEDVDRIGCPRMIKRLVDKSRYDYVMFLGDDTIPEPGFISEALKAMHQFRDGWGVVGLNTQDNETGGNKYAHWMAHKKIREYIDGGDFFPIDYSHAWCDAELHDIASEIGRRAIAEDARITHVHPRNRSAGWDDHYDRAYSKESCQHDWLMYCRRKIARNRRNYGMKLAIAWPLIDPMMHKNFTFSFNAMRKPDHEFLSPIYTRAVRIDSIRNDLVKRALMLGVTHLWMTDTDQIYYDEDTLEKMLSHDADIVTLPVMRGYIPFDPMMWRVGDDDSRHPVPFDELLDAFENGKTLGIDMTGMGSALFNTEVFLNIPQPWFKLPNMGEDGPGEDVYFWNKAHEAGYKILTDCSVNVEHITMMGISFKTHLLYRKLMKMEDRKNGK